MLAELTAWLHVCVCVRCARRPCTLCLPCLFAIHIQIWREQIPYNLRMPTNVLLQWMPRPRYDNNFSRLDAYTFFDWIIFERVCVGVMCRMSSGDDALLMRRWCDMDSPPAALNSSLMRRQKQRKKAYMKCMPDGHLPERMDWHVRQWLGDLSKYYSLLCRHSNGRSGTFCNFRITKPRDLYTLMLQCKLTTIMLC